VLRHVRPRAAYELLREWALRLRARLPAHLLVLLAPGRLHHDAARARDRLGDHLGDEPQADFRLPVDGALAAGDPDSRLLGLGASHVRRRDVELAACGDCGYDASDGGAVGYNGLLVTCDGAGGVEPLPDTY